MQAARGTLAIRWNDSFDGESADIVKEMNVLVIESGKAKKFGFRSLMGKRRYADC